MIEYDKIRSSGRRVRRDRKILRGTLLLSWMPLQAVRSLYSLHRLPLRRLSSAFYTTGPLPRKMATLESLNQEIAAQSAHLVELRKQQAEGSIMDEAKKKLGELKKSLALLQGAGGSRDASKKKERLLLKTAKVGCSVAHEWQ